MSNPDDNTRVEQGQAAGLAPIPPGFAVDPSTGPAIVIRYKNTGMGCIKAFLGVWLAGWTIGCVALLQQYLSGGRSEEGGPVPLWVVLVFWLSEVGVGCLFAHMLFCKRTFRLDERFLTAETDVLGLKRVKVIPKDSIQRLVQVKDGGEGEDSFPSWGLKVEGDRRTTLLFRQPYEQSRWLGQLLAEWAEVDFVQAPRK